MTAFAFRLQRMNRSVERSLANATATWNGGAAFGVLLDRERVDGFLDEAVTAERQVVSLCVANTPGIAEGSVALKVDGRICRISGPVLPDAGGWASFPVFFVGAPDAVA